jgi:hypothetical protein
MGQVQEEKGGKWEAENIASEGPGNSAEPVGQ